MPNGDHDIWADIAPDRGRELARVARLLGALCAELEQRPDGMDLLVKVGADDWWQNQKAGYEKQREKESRLQRLEELRESALAKLTPDELGALSPMDVMSAGFRPRANEPQT